MPSSSVRIRAATRSDYSGVSRVHVSSWKTTYRGIISDAYLDNLTYESREAFWERELQSTNRITLVAELMEQSKSKSEIIGFVSGGENRSEEFRTLYDAELGAIYLLKQYQGRGIGKDLVKKFVHELQNRSFNAMMVWVLELNPFRRFYESLGGKYLGKQSIEIGLERFEKVAYGWMNLEELLK